MIIQIPNINNDVIDTDIIKQEIIDYCEKAISNIDKDKYLRDKYNIIYEAIAPLVKEDFQKGVKVSQEYFELHLLKDFILDQIKLINAETPYTERQSKTNLLIDELLPYSKLVESYNGEVIIAIKDGVTLVQKGEQGKSLEPVFDKIIEKYSDSPKSQKDEKNHNLFIWNKSEKSLIEMFEELSKTKNGFITEESLKYFPQHFSLPDNPTYNYNTEEATKIKWKTAQTHLMWFIRNLNDKGIISIEKGKLHKLTALHFCGLNNKEFVPKDLNSALSNTSQITEKKIKEMRVQEEYEKLYDIITNISD